MDKIFTAKPEKHPKVLELEGLEFKEREQVKTQTLHETAKSLEDKELEIDGYKVVMSNIALEGNGYLRIWLQINKDGKEVFFDNPWYSYGLGLQVHDGTYHKEINHRGNEVDEPNYEYNPEKALKHYISRLIKK